MGSTKAGEIDRTMEVCRDILEREGVNNRGLYFMIAFLRDSGRTLEDYYQHLESRRLQKKFEMGDVCP